MSEIKAGVTVMQDFCRSGTDIFQSYVDYLDREEAQRNDAVQTYNLYHDYMGNPEKTTGLFTKEKDSLDVSEKKDLKNVFQVAQENESIMWQTVISFDNRWLEKNHLYDQSRGLLDEAKLKEVARNAINKMLEKEGLELAVWSAAIHYNTDNIHVHVATVEPYPTRKIMQYQGKYEYRGKFKMKSIEQCKSSVVNEIMHTKEVNQKINQIIRQDIVKAKEGRQLMEEPEFRTKFLQLYQNLPQVSRNLLHYNNSIMKSNRNQIDDISKMYIQKYHAKEHEEFERIVQRQSELYREAYGTADRSYEESKRQDLMERMGNAVLKEVVGYEKAVSQKIDEVTATPVSTIKPQMKREQQFAMHKNPNESVSEEVVDNIEEIEFSLELRTDKKRRELTAELKTELKQAEKVLGIDVTVPSDKEKNEDQVLDDYKEWFKQYRELKSAINPKRGEQIDQKFVQKQIAMGEKKENPFVMYLAGELYSKGRILNCDIDKANRYYSRAFQCFNRDVGQLEQAREVGFSFTSYVQYRIGKQLARGLGVEENKLEAAYWYDKSGTSYARYSLGNLYFQGEGVEQDYELALELFQSIENNAFASLKCAEMYESGLGCEKSKEEAAQYYQTAFRQFETAEEKEPDDTFEYQLGRMLYTGEGCEQNLEKAIDFLEVAADKRNVYAQYLVSKIYIENDMSEKIPRAIELLRDIAEKGNHSNAQYALGKLFTDPDMEYYQLDEGIKYFKMAAEQGHEYAQYSIGKLYTDPSKECYNLKDGMRYLEQAEEQGNEFAQYQLGKLYMDQSLSIYDIEKAVEFFESAKEQGNEYAQYYAGCCYLNKDGSVYNPERGIAYIKELAEQGNEHAQTKLGCEFLKGENIHRDVNEARVWLEKAAEQGNSAAMEILLDIHPQGTGRRGGKGLGELDRALCALQRSFEEEHRRNLQIMRQYELEQEPNIENVL